MNWVRIAEDIREISWQENDLAVVEANDKKVTLCRRNNQLFACAYKCPHAGVAMADGYLDPAGNIVCPLHRYKFSLLNGRNVSGEGYYLKTYPVEQREDGIYVGMEKSWFGW